MKQHTQIRFFSALSIVSLAMALAPGCSDESPSTTTTACDDAEKTSNDCTCSNGKWSCEQDAPQCDDSKKPDGDCSCVDGEWDCTLQRTCPDECPNNCDDDGECQTPTQPTDCNDCEFGCDESGNCKLNCPDECPNNCTDGICNAIDECPDYCEFGCDEKHECLVVTCPESCPDNCDKNGECKPPVTCPESCENGCDSAGNCACPDECTTCDENGACICPDSCANGCTDTGSCACPDSCVNGCTNTGSCLCPDSCANGCTETGSCACPDSCTTGCDDSGKCKKPECPDCISGCDDSGKCLCASTCASGSSCDATGKCTCPGTCQTKSCDATGKCACPSSCPNNCDANGVCNFACDKEVVSSLAFGSPEIDIIAPEAISGISVKNSAGSKLTIKTNTNTYTLDTWPCASKVTLKSADPSIMTVTASGTGAKFTSVKAGKTTCTATVAGSTQKATLTVHVLNPKRLTDNLAEKNSSGKYIHVYQGPLTLSSNRVTQGFDFFSVDSKNRYYFTQLKDGSSSTYKRLAISVAKHTPKATNDNPMLFYGADHGQNLSIEHTDSADYVWLGSYGTLRHSDATEQKENGYHFPQTISRTKYVAGKSYASPDKVTDQYYFTNKSNNTTQFYYGLEPLLDKKNNQVGFRAYQANGFSDTDKTLPKGNGKRYIKIFSLSEAKKMTTSSVKLPLKIKRVDSSNKFATWQPTVTVKDLSKLTPKYEFEPSSTYFYTQGSEIENYILYTVGGIPKKADNGTYTHLSKITVSMFTFGGELIANYVLNTKSANAADCKKDSYYCLSNKDLNGIVTDGSWKYYGHFEPEGIRVTDGKLYLAITAGQKNGSDRKRQFIIVYDLTK